MSIIKDDEFFMTRALELADKAAALGEVPVGAVVVKDGEIIGEGWNQPILTNDPTAHAEVVALRMAAEHLSNYRLPGCTLYVTIEPCTMCVGTMVHSRIERLVYGAKEPKAGVVGSQGNLLHADYLNHSIIVSAGVLDQQCSELMSSFFKQRRLQQKAKGSASKE